MKYRDRGDTIVCASPDLIRHQRSRRCSLSKARHTLDYFYVFTHFKMVEDHTHEDISDQYFIMKSLGPHTNTIQQECYNAQLMFGATILEIFDLTGGGK